MPLRKRPTLKSTLRLSLLTQITLSLVLWTGLFSTACEQAAPNMQARQGARYKSPLRQLEGPPSSLAVNSIRKYSANPSPDSLNAMSTDEKGRQYLRTQLSIGFRSGTTVEEFNSLIKSLDGTILDLIEGATLVSLEIPDPGSLEDYQRLVQQLMEDPRTDSVVEAVFLIDE